MLLLFIAVPVAVLVIGIVFCFIKKHLDTGKRMIVGSSALLLLYAWIFAMLWMMLGGGSVYLSDAVFIVPIFVIPVCAFAAILSGVLAWRKKWGRPVMITSLAVLLAAVLIPLAIVVHNNSIPVVAESSPYTEYDPYAEDSKIVVLDREASFRIEDNYPVLDGATALYPVYSAFFRAVYPEEEFREDPHRLRNKYLRLSTTTGAYQAIVEGSADIIFVASASEKQREYSTKRGVELEFIPLGSEAFVFFVNAKNPLDNITVDDVKRIYTGEVTEWRELGIDGLGEIVAFQRDEGSGSQTAIENLVGRDELIKAPGREIAGMGAMIYQTADYKNYKNAIGYSFRYYTTEMNSNSGLKVLRLNAVEPTVENIKNGMYPVTGNFYAVIRSDAGENVRRFIDWMLSDEGQTIIEKTGYVPLD